MEEKLNYKEPLPEPVVELDVPGANDSFPLHNGYLSLCRPLCLPSILGWTATIVGFELA